ncbi:MAG: DUF192 domain-containing protein [Bryobacterales bacterium]|nr:DUF192 domain-containing protein [Bryobacterales bacterium]
MEVQIWNRSRGSQLASRATVADTSEVRRRGLLGRTSLDAGQGLWIVPCEAVHCWFMKFTIDVLFLNKQKVVLKTRPSLRPWRMSACLRAHSVVELPEGMIETTGTSAGDQIEIIKVAAAT